MIAVDLFAGAGGTSTGLKQAGFRAIAAVEMDQDAVASFRANHPGCHVIAQDIRSVEPKEIAARLGGESLSLLTACPPCQGFSTLGNVDPADERNDLVAEVWRFARVLRPRAILVENVPGLRQDPRFTRLIRQLRGSGYTVWHGVLDASNFRVPQRRTRLVMLAVKGRSGRPLVDPLALVPPQSKGQITAGEALSRVGSQKAGDPVHVGRRHTPSVLERISHIPVGGTRFDLPGDQQLPCHKRLGSRRSAAGPYGRIRKAEPAPTLTTRCTTPSCGPFVHPTENRGITLREAALLQSFPRTYRFVGDYGSIERQIGNAVPVALARALGHAVKALIRDAEQ